MAQYFKISVHELLGENSAELSELKTYDVLSSGVKDMVLKLMNNHDIKNAASLSKLSGIPYSVIEDIVLGKTTNPNITTLQKLSDFFNVPITQILGFEKNLVSSNPYAEKVNIPVFDVEHLHDFTPSYDNILPIKHIASFRRENTQNSFAIQITVDLLPDFSKGDILIVNSEEAPRVNDFVVAKVNHQVFLFECINIKLDQIYFKKAGNFDVKVSSKREVEFFGVVTQKVIG